MSESEKKYKTSSKLFKRIDEEDKAICDLPCETLNQRYWVAAYGFICLIRWFLLYEKIDNELIFHGVDKLTPDERYLLSRLSGDVRGLTVAKADYMELILNKEKALNTVAASMFIQPTSFTVLMAQMLRTVNFKDVSTLLSSIKELAMEDYHAFSVHLLIDGVIRPRECVIKTSKLRGLSVRF